MKLTSISMMAVMICSTVSAQDLKLAGIDVVNYPGVKGKDNGDIELAFKEFGAYFNIPVVSKNKKTIVVNGLHYGLVSAEASSSILQQERTTTFHKITYNFMVIQKLKNNWSVTTRLAPTLASDFNQKLSSDDFMMQGALILNKKLNRFTDIGGGLVYTMRLGKPMLLPGFQLRHEKNRHSLQLFLPAIMNYSYRVGSKDKLKVGFRAAGNGANFNVTPDAGNLAGPGLDRLNYFRANVGPVISYGITKTIQLEAFGGLSTIRKYRFEDTNDHEYRYDTESGGFFNIGIALTPFKSRK